MSHEFECFAQFFVGGPGWVNLSRVDVGILVARFVMRQA